MRKTALVISLVALVWPAPGHAVCNHCTAEQVTLDTAKKLLPGGSDAIGGVGDWYLSNDRVEAVIDDIATVDIDVAGGGTVSVDRTSSNAVATGGTLVDLGLRKKRNDQLPQSFNVGGLSIDNVFLFRQGDEVPWGASTNPCASVGTANPECPADNDDCAAITVYGIMLMPQVSSRTDPKLRVRTRYQACDDDFHLTVTSEVWNQSGATQSLPIIDVFLWGGRGLEPFVPGKGRGFSHPQLDLTNPLALGANLASTRGLYFAAPGNSDNKDGKYTRGKTGNSVSYGYRSLGAKKDSNGGNPGGTLTQIVAPDQVVALHSDFLSAVSIATLLSGTDIPNGQSIVFTREFVVGKKNDVHSVVSDRRNPSNLITKIYGDGVGRVSGRFRPGSKNFGTVTFIRIGDRPGDPPLSPPIGGQTDPAKQGNEPVTSVRTKAGWSNVLLPPGLYALHIVVPGRDEVIVKECTGGDNDGGLCQDDSECPGGGVCGFSVGPFEKVSFGTIDVPEKEGLLEVEITDADTGERIPAKLSLDPSPNMRRELAAYSFAQRFNFSLNLFRGMCANDFTVGCNSSADCGGNTCFSTCSNQEPKKCTDNSDCNTGAGEVCASDKRCRSEACTSDSDCDPGAICVPDTAETDVASFAGGPGQKNVIYTHNGKVKERIRPGTYTIYVSRGIEYTIQKLENVVVPSGGTVELAASLRRVVDTTGYMSADFHIHSGRSLDSSAPFEDRVRSFAGEGLEVMVSTDHDITTDYEPVIKKLGLRDFIAAIPGTEITTSVSQPPYASNAWGHINAWPQVFGLFAPRNGSIEDEGVSPNVIFDRARGSVCSGGDNDGLRCTVDADCPGGDCVVHGKMCAGGKDAGNPCTDDSECRKGTCADVVVQLNHPRAGVSGVVGIGQFNNIGFDPSAPLTDCQKYPVVCPSNRCVGGTNDGGTCTTQAQCPGGVCGCVGGSLPASPADGCNKILLDRNVQSQATICDTAGCGSGFENPNGTRNIDFDVMEVDNGGQGLFTTLVEERRDWISLLNQGVLAGRQGNQHPIWGTGVSDSHRIVVELPGYSRSFVGAGDLPTAPDTLNVRAFNEAVLAGNMVGSSGPFVRFTVDDGTTTAGIGETLAANGSVNLDIEVQAPPWMPVDEVRIIKNGCVIQCFDTGTTPAVDPRPADPFEQNPADLVRFSATISDTVTSDSYYIVEASQDPDSTSLDATVSLVAKDAFPYAFTNPIFVDADGGGYGGLGVPEPTCPPHPPECSTNSVVQQ